MPGGYRKNSPPSQNRDQVAHFVVEVRFIADRLGDGGPQQLTVTLPQPMHGHFDRAFAHAQSRRNLVPGRLFLTAEAALERERTANDILGVVRSVLADENDKLEAKLAAALDALLGESIALRQAEEKETGQ